MDENEVRRTPALIAKVTPTPTETEGESGEGEGEGNEMTKVVT
jgi:hypothetical protein